MEIFGEIDMSYEQQLNLELIKAGFSLAVAAITLGFGWLIGLRLTVYWNLRQKRRELNFANLQQFYAIYGDFKETSKIWRIVKRDKEGTLRLPSDCRWSLLTKACAVESENEAIIVKLATERKMGPEEAGRLGLFRQALQTLRESIRDDKEVPSSSRGPEYVFFNSLAAEVACFILAHRSETELRPRVASDNLEAIASIRRTQFENAIAAFKAENPQYEDEAD